MAKKTNKMERELQDVNAELLRDLDITRDKLKKAEQQIESMSGYEQFQRDEIHRLKALNETLEKYANALHRNTLTVLREFSPAPKAQTTGSGQWVQTIDYPF